MFRYLLVNSKEDPVAQAVWELWNTRGSTGLFVGRDPIYRLTEEVAVVQRDGHHVEDEALATDLPPSVQDAKIPLVFPSIHRSEQGVLCFTVHPLGNVGRSAEVGGRSCALVPAPARLMVDALRQLNAAQPTTGLLATYETTHHGPWLENPAFFVEIGFGSLAGPPQAAVRALARILLELQEDPADRVVVGVGGGHYAPHFTDLALRRHWAFGHLLSRHTLAALDSDTARQAVERTPGCEGLIFARAEDARAPMWQGAGPRLRDQDAARRS